MEKKKDQIQDLERHLDFRRQRLLKEQKDLADSQAGFTVQEKKEALVKGEIQRLSLEVLQSRRH